MSQESILNIVLSAIVALTAIFALFQTHRQIKLSNKQILFNRRLDKYLLAKSLIELYKDNINLLDYKDNKDDEAIIVDFQFINLTNIEYLKDIACIISDPKNNEYKTNFLIKIEELKKLSTEIKFIFPNKESQYLSKFVFNYQNILMELYKYQVLLDNMTNDKIPRKQKPSYKELQKEYGELTHRKRLYDAIDNLNNSYDELVENKTINKIENSIKL